MSSLRLDKIKRQTMPNASGSVVQLDSRTLVEMKNAIITSKIIWQFHKKVKHILMT